MQIYTKMTKQLPVIVILGATACGKSKLAIDLARRFGGEIISADSMQIYKGLDIVTNKVTQEEQLQAKHHMINFVHPTQRFSVIDFCYTSLNLINDIHKRNSLPIIVGGTHYYIESLIWKNFLVGLNESDPKSTLRDPQTDKTLIEEEYERFKQVRPEELHSEEDLEDPSKFFKKKIFNDGLKQASSEKLWKILEQVDPNTAHRYHPNDKRRIIRSLQIIQANNKTNSQLLDDLNRSKVQPESTSLGGALRFKKTCVIWLDCDNTTLRKILDERVDQMLERGLLAELENFHSEYNKSSHEFYKNTDYTKGILQTIGFKEFHDYLVLDETDKVKPKGELLLAFCVDRMKTSTWQYSRRQLQWIKRRFMFAGKRDLPPVFRLSTTWDESEWSEKVRQPAIKIVESVMGDDKQLDAEVAKLRQEPVEQEGLVLERYHCLACDKIMIGRQSIEQHQHSKHHRLNVSAAKRAATDEKAVASSTSVGEPETGIHKEDNCELRESHN